MEGPGRFCLIFQLEIDGCLVGKGDAGQYLHRLMVLHDLYRADILVADSVGRYAVFAAQQVGTFNVEFVDVFALILDLSVVGDINTGHASQYIADGAVLGLGETADIVGDGISLFAYAVGFDGYLLE